MTVGRQRTPAASGASYSDAVVVGVGGARWIYVAGQTPRPSAGAGSSDVPADLGGQSERCFDQIEQILAAYGAAPADVVQITVYLTDLTQYEQFAAVRARRFGADPPSSAAVGVATLLDDALVEIAAVAVAAST